MISISAPTYDLNGNVIIVDDAQTKEPDLKRRVTRTATLDGASTISDMGYSDSDGVYNIKSNYVDVDKLKNLIQNYSLLTLSTKNGVFSGVISKMNVSAMPVQITFLIEKKLS